MDVYLSKSILKSPAQHMLHFKYRDMKCQHWCRINVHRWRRELNWSHL